MKKTKIFYLLAFLTAVIFSCRNESCMETMDSHVNIHFYKHRSIKDSAIYYLTAYGVGHSDSTLYKDKNLIYYINLPLDQNNDETQFFLSMTMLADTIHFLDSTRVIDTIKLEPVIDTIWKYKYVTKVKNILESFDETLTIRCKRDLELVNPECGFHCKFVIDSVWSTKNIIDSIFIRKPSIDRGSDEENIKIFL